MGDSPINILLYKNLQEGKGTDCSFTFKNVKSDDGQESTKVINAHRCILSAVSSYFEANLKSTWKGDEPIEVTTVEYPVFKKILKAIYLCEIDPFANLQDAIPLYEAAHFYQLDGVTELSRNEIRRYCNFKKKFEYELVITIFKHQDYCLIEFFRNFFISNAVELITGPNFMNYPTEAINMLYQIENLPVGEVALLNELEKYIEKHGSAYINLLKPAIRSIRFGSLPIESIKKTTLLSEVEKNTIYKQQETPFMYLSKGTKGRR